MQELPRWQVRLRSFTHLHSLNLSVPPVTPQSELDGGGVATVNREMRRHSVCAINNWMQVGLSLKALSFGR